MRRPAAVVLWVSLPAAGMFACNAILGNLQDGVAGPAGDAGDGGLTIHFPEAGDTTHPRKDAGDAARADAKLDAGADAECASGQRQCADGKSQVCVDGGWASPATCSSNAVCTFGGCLSTLASGQGNAGALSVNETNVYWSSSGGIDGGSVGLMSALLDGTEIKTLNDAPTSTGLAIDSSRLYWTVPAETLGTVIAAGLDGGTPTTLASGLIYPEAMVVTSSGVFWIQQGPDGAIFSVPLSGGEPTPLSSGWMSPQGITADDTSIYFTNSRAPGAGVYKVSVSGGSKLLSAPNSPAYGIAVDSTNVYWTNDVADGSVMSVGLDGGTATTLAANQPLPSSITVNDGYVYWLQGSPSSSASSGAVMRVPLGGGAPVTLASGQETFYFGGHGIAVDATSVYWTTTTTVMKLTPK